jgi:hypothetical protein
VAVLAFAGGTLALGETAGPGKGLIYSTFLGGTALDEGHDIALDAAGNVYLVVFTQSPNFPVTAGSFDTTFNGVEDTVIMKLDATGARFSLIWKTWMATDCWTLSFRSRPTSSRSSRGPRPSG